jgi:hypothetical protein
MSDPPNDTTAGRAPRYMRRLSDKILTAFHLACDHQDIEMAGRLLTVLEVVIAGRWHQPTAPDRRGKESLVAAYERLWDLRHPDTDEGLTLRSSAVIQQLPTAAPPSTGPCATYSPMGPTVAARPCRRAL